MEGRIVIKVGSSTLTGEDGRLDEAYLAELVEQVSRLRADGAHVLLVSSGAIAAGMEALGMERRPTDMSGLQAAAAVGQVSMIGKYAELFARRGVPVGQVLLTRHETTHRQQYLLACNTLERLVALDAVPVVNENDTTAVDEIAFGDNDSLAALVAIMVRADLVIMLTDIEGLHTADPRTDSAASLVEHVEEVTDEMIASAGGPGSAIGSGGMVSKIEAAKMLRHAGIPMVLCDGRREGVVMDAARGERVGTRFAKGDRSLTGRKLWIAFGRHSAGSIVVDDGAREALTARGTSLLFAGVVDVVGDFAVGDAVAIEDSGGAVIARGLASLSAGALRKVKGMKTAQVRDVLPDETADEAVHRDQLVIL